jgi:predicted Zn finger-like uncharacterized protein
MKIICDSCGTKYSISDDKVRGKVFKIRCKKCSHIIVVRGGEGQEEAAAAPAAAAAEGGWHIVVEGEQVGPIPEADVRSRIERGELRADTYIWKEGFADWLKLSAVPEFADLVPAESGSVSVGDVFASDSAAPQPTNGTERSGGRRRSGANRPLFGDGGADVFAAPAAAAPASGGDLFGSHSSSSSSSNWPSSGGGGVSMAGHDGGRVENLTGQRHENSVLFSLSNLQSLAMPAAKPAASVNLGSAPAPTTEGSGLIDIRAMAASTRGLPADGPTSTADDDLPAFGAFSPAAPVLLPMSSSSGPPWWIWLVIVGMLGVVGVVGYAAFRVISPKEVVVVKEVQVPAPAPAPTKAGAVTAKTDDKDKSPSTIAEKDLPPREGAAPGKEGDKGKESGKGSSHHSSKSGSKDAKKPIAAADDSKKGLPTGPVPGEPPKPKKGSLEDLLNDAAPKSAKSGPRVDEDKKGGGGEGPGPLPKNALVAGLKGVQPKINACYNQFKVPGTAMVNVVIGKSGKVTSAAVTGKFAGTPTGQCVEAAVKTASFPPSDGFTTPYPFQLK